MSEERVIPIQLRAAREAFSSVDGFLAFGFGAGLVPKAPGTVGTLVAVPLAFVVKGTGGLGFWLSWLMLFALGVWICERVGRRLGVEDYGGIVWDEMVGYWLVIAFIPMEWGWLLAAFVLFRFFDVVKPWPINALEPYIPGGLGVMLDDVLAAIYAIILLAGVRYVLA